MNKVPSSFYRPLKGEADLHACSTSDDAEPSLLMPLMAYSYVLRVSLCSDA